MQNAEGGGNDNCEINCTLSTREIVGTAELLIDSYYLQSTCSAALLEAPG